MSAAPVGSVAAASALVLQADSAQGLAPGQVIQAKVLRHLDAGRYLVRLGGQERVVDSRLPLRPDEVLSLRVAGSRERIELERVERDALEVAGSAADGAGETPAGLGGGSAALIEELFRRYRGTLDSQESERLRRSVARAARPDQMALAGLVLNKTGLPIRAELLGPLYEVIGAPSGALAPIPELNAEQGAPAWWPLAQVVLNVQGGGSIAHRIGMLPLESGDRVIEVEVALFEERDAGAGAAQAPSVRHRKLVLALETENLGRLELRAVMADSHIRVALAAESSAATNALLRHGEALAGALAGAGWQVDEISHETRARSAANGVVGAAVEHIVTPGSVSRLA